MNVTNESDDDYYNKRKGDKRRGKQVMLRNMKAHIKGGNEMMGIIIIINEEVTEAGIEDDTADQEAEAKAGARIKVEEEEREAGAGVEVGVEARVEARAETETIVEEDKLN